MLEKLVSNMITSYLGKYIENLDRKNVSVSLWSGQVDLKDLYVRQSALRGMNLPISVKEGKIGSLKVRIPWTRLQSEPIVFNISDLVIILHPKSAAQYDEEAEEEEQLAYKREQLEALEHMRQAGLTDAAAASAKTEPSPNSYDEDDQDESSAQHQKKVAALEKAKDNSFTSRIKASMLSNAQLELRNIVIMYEDLITDPTQPVHFTIRIDGLSAQSSTADDRPTFANPSDRFLYKLLQCENFRVGVEMAKHMGRSATAGKSIKDILTQFQSTGKPTTAAASPPSSSDLGGFTEEQCLVSPTNFSLRLQHQPIPYEVTVPRWLATAKIPEAQVRVDRQQWDCVWRSVKYVERYEDIKFFFRFRPSGSSQWTPQLRWNFAIQSTLYVVRKQLNKGKFNWNDYIEKKRLQTEYIDLFRRSQPEASEWALALSKEEVPRLTVIEKALPLEMLRTARNLAFARIDLEKIQYEKKVQYNARLEAVREKKLQKAKQAGGTATGNSSNSTGKVGWLAWMSGGYIKDKPVDKHVKRDILDIVDENLESPLPDGDEQDPDDEVADDTKFTAEEASEMFQILDAKRWTAEQRKVLAKEFGMDWEENVILNDAVVATIGAEGIDSDTASAGSPHSSRPLKKSQGEAFTGSSREALPLPASMSYAKPNASRAKSIEEDEKIPPPTSSKQMHDISAHFEVTRVSILLMDYKRQPFADFSVSGAIVSYHATKDTFAAHMTLREFHVVDASIPNSRPIISAASDRAIAPHPLCPRQNMFALKFGKLDKVLGNGIDYDISFGSAPLDVCFMVPWMQQVVSFWGENSGLSDVKKLHQQQQNAQNANSTPLVQLLMKVERQKISNLGCSLHGLRLIIPEARRSRDSDSVFVKQECAIEVPLLTLQNDPKFSLERRRVLQKVRAKLRATEFPERITLLLYPEGVEASHYTNNFFIAIKDLRISTSYLDPTVRPPKKPEILSHYILARASLDLTLTNLMVKDNTDVPGTSIDISSTNELCIEGPRKMWLVLLNAVTLLLEFNGNKNGTGSKLVEQGKVFKRGESGEPFHARVIGPRQRFIHADEDIRPLNQQLQEVPVADQDRYVLVHYGSMVIYHAERPSMPFLQLELKQHAVTVVAHKLAESDMKRNRIHKDYIYYDEEEDENGEALKGRVHAVTVFVHSGGAEHHHRKGLFEARALLQKHNIPLFNSLPQQHQAVEFVTSVLNSARKLSQYEVSQIHEAYAIVQRSFHTNPCDAVTFVFTTEAEQAKFAAEVQKHASPDGFVAPPMEFLSYRGELAPPLPKQNQRSMNLNINIPGARISIVPTRNVRRIWHPLRATCFVS